MAVKMKNTLKVIVFLLIGLLIFFKISSVFGVSNSFSEHAEMMINGFYDLKKDSVDVLFVGNSHVYRYWQNGFAWDEYGMAASAFSTSDMPCGAVKNVLIEAQKTQHPKVYVIDATVFANNKDTANNKIYLLLNNMKFSYNYIDLLNNFCKYSNWKKTGRMPYYLPIVQFHSRWDSLTNLDFQQTQTSYLNSCYQEDFLTSTIPDKKHTSTDQRVAIAEKSEAALRNLLEWCQSQEDAEILFYVAPILKEEDQLARLNYVCDIIQEYHQDVINFNETDLYNSFGFVVTDDFQDINHTNIRGSYKFTKQFGKYLVETYSLTDHRSESDYASWNDATKSYLDIVSPYLDTSN